MKTEKIEKTGEGQIEAGKRTLRKRLKVVKKSGSMVETGLFTMQMIAKNAGLATRRTDLTPVRSLHRRVVQSEKLTGKKRFSGKRARFSHIFDFERPTLIASAH